MSGKIVQTIKGTKGQTEDKEKTINGKLVIHTDDGKKIICHPDNIKVIGYWSGKDKTLYS